MIQFLILQDQYQHQLLLCMFSTVGITHLSTNEHIKPKLSEWKDSTTGSEKLSEYILYHLASLVSDQSVMSS